MTSIDQPSRIDPTQSRATKTRLKATTAVKPLQPAAHSKSSIRKARSKRPAKKKAHSSSKVDKVLSLLKRPGGGDARRTHESHRMAGALGPRLAERRDCKADGQ
jgi:hypothetical protein